MSEDDAKLRFLSWMRRGLACAITGSSTIDVGVELNGTPVSRTIRLRGPGDVIGLSSRQVLRMDPPEGTADFEPNYFAAMELASPDLPWMFTPDAPVNDQLMPWMVLIVVEEREGVSLGVNANGSLPVLSITSSASTRAADELPDLSEAWAWAHVQSAVEIAGDISGALAASPEAFIARLVCPRRLDASTPYIACVVPSFAQGVRAGLGESVDVNDTSLAWSSTTESIVLPVYHSWKFRTGPSGDFESLVRRLKARELGADVGVRDLDVGSPGGGLPEAPGTTLTYQGALLSPTAQPRAWKEPHKTTFQSAMGLLLESPVDDEPQRYEPLRDDPIVAPPSYGLIPSEETEVPAPNTSPRWLGDVNLDPVQRATAGLGAEVVRANQEQLVAQAWDQMRPLRRINQLLACSRLAAEISVQWKSRVTALDDGALLQIAAPALGRITDTTHGTLATRVAASDVPNGTVSAAFRRAVRRGGAAGKSLGTLSAQIDASSGLTARLSSEPAQMLAYASLVRPAGTVIDQPLSVGSATASSATLRRSRRASAARVATGDDILDSPVIDSPVIDSPVLDHPYEGSVFDIGFTASKIRTGLDPMGTIGARLQSAITAPAWGAEAVPERMAGSPVLDDPTYEMLVRIGPDYLVPGIGSVPMDTIGLLVPNAKFVEAFLLGVNHELGCELMWREVPVDFTDTWMTRFWDAPAYDGDIPQVRDWSTATLGAHVTGAAKQVGLVLLIKGALLRRYPDTRIYAVPAKWAPIEQAAERTATTTSKERVEDTSKAALEPLFSGTLGSDTRFFAFDLSEEDARGSTNESDGTPGWFVVFEECPTGTRFGLDVEKPAHAGDEPRFWKNVSWGHLVDELDALETLSHVPTGGRLSGTTHLYDTGEFEETWGETAAGMARITFQRPVRMLVHMDSMLPDSQTLAAKAKR